MACSSAPPHHHDHQSPCGKDQADLICKDALSLYLCIFCVSLSQSVSVSSVCVCEYLYIHVFSVWSLSFQFSFDVVFVNLYAHLFF